MLKRFLRHLRRLPPWIAQINAVPEQLEAIHRRMLHLEEILEGLTVRQQQTMAMLAEWKEGGIRSASADENWLLGVRRQQAFSSHALDVVTCLVEDMILSFPAEDIGHASTWLYNPRYDIGQRQLIRSYLRPGMTVVDVGANVGVFSVLASRLVGPQGRVIAYEPIPRLAEVIRSNLLVNAPRNRTEIRMKCAYSRADTLNLQVFPENSRVSTLAPYKPDAWVAEDTQIAVSCVRLDEDLDGIDGLDLLKIDAEGAECDVLEGANRLLERFRSAVVLCEFEPEHLLRARSDPGRFIALCRAQGFHVALVHDETGALEWLRNLDDLGGFRGNVLLSREEIDLRKPHTIAPNQLKFVDDFRSDAKFLTASGTIVYEAVRHGSVTQDVLFYGPYIHLDAGRYAVRLMGQLSGTVRIRTTAEHGRISILDTTLDNLDTPIVIELPAPVENFEVVGIRTDDLAAMTLSSIQLEPLA